MKRIGLNEIIGSAIISNGLSIGQWGDFTNVRTTIYSEVQNKIDGVQMKLDTTEELVEAINMFINDEMFMKFLMERIRQAIGSGETLESFDNEIYKK